MSHLRLSTHIAPGMWLSQRVSLCGCVFMALLLGCPIACVLLVPVAGLAEFLNKLAAAIIPLWGR